jgi:hypothetical protein
MTNPSNCQYIDTTSYVTVSGSTGLSVTLTNPLSASFTVTGSFPANVTVSNFPAVQQVTGTVDVTGLATQLSTTHTRNVFTASLASVQVLAPNPGRIGVTFSYQVTPTTGTYGNAYVCVGSVASTSSYDYCLQAGAPGYPGTVCSPDTLSDEAYSVVFDWTVGAIIVTEFS